MTKKKVIAYFDGSNFYHHCKENYGITDINYYELTVRLLDLSKNDLVRIKYFNSPINQNEYPQKYAAQQKFFAKLRSTPLVQVLLGKLVQRPIHRMHINCPNCGHQESENLECPVCKNHISIDKCFKYLEKGVDVQLATHLLIDALTNSYDVALIFSSDADYCPAIKYVVRQCKKEVIYCHFPRPRTNELLQMCSSDKLITKTVIENSRIGSI